jgi:hypothetical protein
MDNYIICEKRGNLPRIHVKICQHRCEHAKACEAFQDYMKAKASAEMVIKPATGDWPGEKAVASPTP